MLITADMARAILEKRYTQPYPEPNGVNVVSDHDEDYLVDALFDIPNR